MTNDTQPDFETRDAPEAAADHIDGWASLKRLFLLIRPYLASLFAITVLMLAVTGIAMTIPKVAGDIIDSAVSPELAGRIDVIALQLLGLIVAMAALKYVSSYWLSKVGSKFLYGMRE